MSAAKAWIEQGTISPALGIWWVHGCFLVFALILLASQNGYLEIVTALIGANANVDASLLNGMSSIHLAAQYGYTNIVVTLIDAGANVLATNAKGDSALDIAKQKGHIDISRILNSTIEE